MYRYIYSGPVLQFGKCIQNCWNGITYAVSEKKARSNLEYQFKRETGRLCNAKVSLPGKIILS